MVPCTGASSEAHQSCPADTPLSCSSGSDDSCCYEGTNGLFLQTQFWDYDPSTGPDNAWTVHGLWSDKCGGGFNQYCNKDWEIDSASSTLSNLGMDDLLDEMKKVWKNQGDSDDELWTHEFNKHGTCMSTVSPSCYGDSNDQKNVGDFYSTVLKLYKTLPTYDFLKQAGIEPSEDKTWNIDEFSNALTKHTNGHSVYLGCDDSNAITQLWYFFKLKGSVADGTFHNVDSVSSSTCKDGFKYKPKSQSSNDGGNSGGCSGGSSGGSNGDSQKGYLNVDGYEGCLISDGSWYTSGTCATFHINSSSGNVNVKSSKGSCGIQDGGFKCGSGVDAADFKLTDGYLSYDGSSEWSASQKPQGQDRESISTGSGSVTFKLKLSS